jgi:hypothetical protein
MRTLFIALTIASFGCASIVHGTTQDVSIATNPSGAKVSVDGQTVGNTPVIAHLKRGENHSLKAELPGYAPYEMAFTKSASGWVWGNVLFGGLIGLAVDAISGGFYYLTPEQVMAEMRNQPAAKVSGGDDGIAVFIVMEPRPEWKLVAQMEPRR